MAFDFTGLWELTMAFRRWNPCKPCCTQPCCQFTDCDTPDDGTFGEARGTPRLTISDCPNEVSVTAREIWYQCSSQTPPDAYPCWAEGDLENITTWKWIGMAALNGSYSPVPYYVGQDGKGTTNINNAVSPCGFWMYPIIDINLTFQTTRYRELQFQGGSVLGCIPTSTVEETVFPMKLRTIWANLDLLPAPSLLPHIPNGPTLTITKTSAFTSCTEPPLDAGVETTLSDSNDPLLYENFYRGKIGSLYSSRYFTVDLNRRSFWSIGFSNNGMNSPIDGFPSGFDIVGMNDCRHGMLFSNFSSPSHYTFYYDSGAIGGTDNPNNCRNTQEQWLSPWEITRQFDIIPP